MDNLKTINDFNKEVKDIIYNLSLSNINNVKITGSMAINYQLYASDFDLYESLNDNYSRYVKKFQQVIKHFLKQKNVFIGDIKSGEIKKWNILDGDKITIETLNNKINNLYNNGIINDDEKNESLKLLKLPFNDMTYYKMKDLFKFHIVRWTPQEVIKGYKTLRDGSKYTLKESFKTGLTKIDLVVWLENRFVEFSMIYAFRPDKNDISKSLKDDIKKFQFNQNYFKMSKRIFSLSQIYDDKTTINILSDLFNSDLGILYLLNSDIKTLIYLFENVDNLPYNRIKKEFTSFNKRLRNIKLYFSDNKMISKIINKIKQVEKAPNIDDLVYLNEELDKILSIETRKYLELNQILPLKQRYLL